MDIATTATSVGPIRRFLDSIVNPRPRHFLSPGQATDVSSKAARRYGGATGRQLVWSVENPGDAPVQIAGITVFPARRSLEFVDNTETGATRWFKYKQHGKYSQWVGPRERKTYHLSEIHTRVVLVVWWHRNGLLKLRFPMVSVISPKRIDVINGVTPDVPI
jgi:hypothetical protein